MTFETASSSNQVIDNQVEPVNEILYKPEFDYNNVLSI